MSFRCVPARTLLQIFRGLVLYSSHKRQYAAFPKRFYQEVRVISNGNSSYEIILDQKKVKTPAGNILEFQNESLALAVAAEWDSQRDIIRRSSMHLTGLSNTVIDNPNGITKSLLVASLTNFLDTDTILYHTDVDNELYKLQLKEWSPIIGWFNEKYHVNVCPVRGISSPLGDQEAKEILSKFFNSFTFQCVQGFSFAVENLKSVILTLYCFYNEVSVEKAVFLSRLEEEFQMVHWGRVEWAHDLSVADTQSRVSAAITFIRLNLESSVLKSK